VIMGALPSGSAEDLFSLGIFWFEFMLHPLSGKSRYRCIGSS